MRSKFAASVLSIALGLSCLGGAFTLTGCGGGSTTGTTVPVKTTPTITWSAPAAITYGTALGSTQLSATASVPGSFAYSPAAGAILGVGTQTLSVTFTPNDTTNYNTASATVQLVVGKVTPTITWSAPAAITYGVALSGTQLNATASVAGTLVYTPAAGTTPKAGTQALSVAFTPTDATDYATASANVNLVVNQASPTVSAWPVASAITSGQALSASALTGGTASVSGSFAWTAPSTVPAVGTDPESVTFTPTDSADYTSVTANVQVVVNPTTPTITSITPRYMVQDTFTNVFAPFTMSCAGCVASDIVTTTVSGTTSTSTLPGTATTYYGSVVWNGLGYEPTALTQSIQHPGGPMGNSWSLMFFGSGSQSTLAISPKTGTIFQYEEKTGCLYTLPAGAPCANKTAQAPGVISVDDTTGDVVGVSVGAAINSAVPSIGITPENGNAFSGCYIKPTGITTISSVAAKGGYIVATAPNENLVLIASLAGCSGGVAIGYQSVSIAGQPWSVAIANGNAYVLSRDKCANGIPCLTSIGIASAKIVSAVDLPGVTPVSTIRATTPYEGLYQVVAFNSTPVVSVLFMSDQSDGIVLTVNTSTMKVAFSTPVPELPYIIAPQDGTTPLLRVGYILSASGEAVTHIGDLNPATGNYTSGVGVCPTGLVGGLVATANGVYCAGGPTIAPPLVLP